MGTVVWIVIVSGRKNFFDVLGEYQPPIFWAALGRGRTEHRSNKCKRFKTKAGFGEGTPQQVRPVSETRFQILKLWPQVDTCLSLFPSKMKIQLSNWISFSKAGKHFRTSLVQLTCADERDTDREIQTRRVYERSECAVLGLNFVPKGILGGRNFCPAYAGRNGFPLKRARGTQIEVSPIAGVAAYTESAFLPLYCSGVVRLTRICAGSWRGIQIQTADAVFKVRV